MEKECQWFFVREELPWKDEGNIRTTQRVHRFVCPVHEEVKLVKDGESWSDTIIKSPGAKGYLMP